MRQVIIGHRGVGKTALLQRCAKYFPDIECLDLDAEIEKKLQENLASYFEREGEYNFREVEKRTFFELIKNKKKFILAAGGGFDVSIIPQDIEVLFVTRVTDVDGRIFLNRPRLEKDLSPLEESQIRYIERQPQFMKRADFVYDMPEGLSEPCAIEKNILSNNYQINDAYYTLSAKDLEHIERLTLLYKQIELRTDLINEKKIEELIELYPTQKWLVSVRSHCDINLNENCILDCDVKFQFRRFEKIGGEIISSHADSVDVGIGELASVDYKSVHLKLSPVVNNFAELKAGYEWQQQDAENRSFLPRSRSGRWQWYRLLSRYLQKLNFVRSRIPLADQPTLHQWLSLPNQKPHQWAAVLGSPVYFSRSPNEHRPFMSQLSTFMTAVELNESELKENILFLHQLGLCYAAVTSPLKQILFELADEASLEAREFGSANTLFAKEGRLFVHNTDLEGFQCLLSDVSPEDSMMVWGGGGTLRMMQKVLPCAQYYSSRSAANRSSIKESRTEFDDLIWAAPRNSDTQYPPESLQFKRVIDLNYVENSMGLEFAARRKLSYISGLKMFKAQAAAQQLYWLKCEGQNERK